MVSVLIADDHPIVRSGLTLVLSSDPSIGTVHEAGNGDAALQLIRQHRPALAVLDVEMPELDGIAVAEAVHSEELPTDVIIMTMHNNEQTLNRAMRVNVKGFVSKETGVTDIRNAVHAVLEGKHYFSPMFQELLRTPPRTPLDTPGIGQLTLTERAVLDHIAESKTTNAIAAAMNVSPKTVEKHRSNICQKLGLRGSYALLKYAMNRKR